MLDQKHQFVMGIPIRSAQFADRVEAFFDGNTLREEINDFWDRHSGWVSDWADEYWESCIAEGHVKSAQITVGPGVTREQVGKISAQIFKAIFVAKKETDWMKALARTATASWLVDDKGNMMRNMQGYSEGLIVRLKEQADNVDQAMDDILFVNRMTLMQFEIVSAYRTELDVRYAESKINSKGNDFVTSLADKIDISLKASEIVNEAAIAANEKISGLRKDTTEAAAISEQSALAMQDAARSAGDLQQTLNSVTNGLSEGKSLLVKAVEQAQRTTNDNADVAREVAAIEEVVKTISSIAEQTNILALNASIEAARAGASGAGFAVVAQEVKSLAGQTAKATETVTQRIAAIQTTAQQSEHSSGEMLETTARLRTVSDSLLTSLQKALETFSKITDAVDETAQGAANIGDLVANINRDTDAVSGLVEQLSGSSKDTAGKLAGLVEETSHFVQAIGKR